MSFCPCTGCQPRRASSAMTLVEMLVVLMLIGLLAGSAVVALDGRQGDHVLRTAAEDLATAIRFAARQSTASSRPHRLVFSEEQQAYRVEQLARGTLLEFEPVRGLAGTFRRMPASVTIEGVQSENPLEENTQVLEFRPGESSFSGTIKLVHVDGQKALLNVVGETGQVHVQIQ